jgi:hypothetical protein
MKWVTNLTWSDAVHLTPEKKAEMLAGMSPHERDARTKGLPYLGSGAIYPFNEDTYIIDPIRISDRWPRAFALDVGYIHPTAAVWGAYDQRSDTWYIYSEYKRAQAEVSTHVDAILARGRWIKGVVDPNSDRTSQGGEEAVFRIYERFGVELAKADNAVEPGIMEVYQRLSSGRIKIFAPLLNLRSELRVYRRDVNGRIVKKGDDLIDALRYLIMSGLQVADLPPLDEQDPDKIIRSISRNQSSITGY